MHCVMIKGGVLISGDSFFVSILIKGVLLQYFRGIIFNFCMNDVKRNNDIYIS